LSVGSAVGDRPFQVQLSKYSSNVVSSLFGEKEQCDVTVTETGCMLQAFTESQQEVSCHARLLERNHMRSCWTYSNVVTGLV